MGAELEITVCHSCAWTDKKVRKALEKLVKAHGDRLVVRHKGCLDACKKDPAVKVGSKLLAPAKPKKIRKAAAKKLA